MRLGLAALLVAAAAGFGSAPAAAQTAPPPTKAAPPSAPAKKTTPGARASGTPRAKRSGPPLDFSGVWTLDAAASQGVSPAMEGAVLSVRQNGNHIWIEPVEKKKVILAEEIVVDGRRYEKGVGLANRRKGTLTADWGNDRDSLWLQVEVAGENPDEPAGVQRGIWRLRDGGATWTRQTRTITKADVKDTFLVFRRKTDKPADKPAKP
jgi:hypothetical protein